MAGLHVAEQKQEQQASTLMQSPPSTNDPPPSSSSSHQRRRQRQISSSGRNDSITSSRSTGKRKKRLARQLSRRLSDMFAAKTSSSMGESSTHPHHASTDGKCHQQRRSLIDRAARRDSLADVYDRISRGEAKYVPGVDHLSLLAQISTLDNNGDVKHDGSFLFGNGAEEDEAYEAETKNVKISRAA